MRDFLAYVCDRALNQPDAEIREQDIGCAVFGRAPDYDTNQDNIVRVNASQLRKKLESYFASEGAAETLILELPRGHYRPSFRVRSEPAGVQPVEAGWRANPRSVWFLLSLSAILLLLSLVLSAALISRRRAPVETGQPPAMQALWSQFFKKGQVTDIVLSDSSLGLMADLTGMPVPLSEYIHPDTWRQAATLADRPDAQLAARLAARRRHTDMASVNASRRILSVAGTDQGRVNLYFARGFNLNHMKSDNVILLGSRRTNPWVEIVESGMHFRFGFNVATRQGYFKNTHPSAGEPPEYANDPATSYCQVVFMPNLSRTGNILVISGTDVEGTEAGGEFLTSEAGLASLRQRLAANRAGSFPYFEVILKSTRIGGATPGCEIVAYRHGKSN